MRHVASYAFEARDPSGEDFHLQELVQDCAEEWLESKGHRAEDGKTIRFRDGRTARLRQTRAECSLGRAVEIVLEEPIEGGTLATSVKIGGKPAECCVSVALSAAAATLAPQFTEIRTPRLIRTVLELSADWRYRATPISARPIHLAGTTGGDSLNSMIWEASRCLPMIAVSEDAGFVPMVDLESQLSADLAALAIVVRIDEQASWRVTEISGREWSCYGGAVRVYWPGVTKAQSPFRHPLWTPGRLFERAADAEDAAAGLRRQLRRTILAQSAFAISPSPQFAEIQHAARVDELECLKQRVLVQAQDVAAANELVAHAADLEGEKYRLQLENLRLHDEIERLRSEKSGLIAALSSTSSEEQDFEPEVEAPPDSLKTALDMAKRRFPLALIFGEDVEAGICDVRDEPRAADKVLRGLTALGELALELQRGPIGVDALRWLNERGHRASGESETTRNSQRLMAHRSWGNGLGQRQTFEHHLKPTNGTSPDKCIRIYFQHDPARRAMVVGWIGRHPPEK